MHLQLISAADGPKITDWWAAIAATATPVIIVVLTIVGWKFTAGYRMQFHAFRDQKNQLQLEVFNSRRTPGQVTGVEFVVRASPLKRMFRKLLRKNNTDHVLTLGHSIQLRDDNGSPVRPTNPTEIAVGLTSYWRIIVPDPDRKYVRDPGLREAKEGESGDPINPRRLDLCISLGGRRPRYLHYQRILPFRRIVLLEHVLPAESDEPEPQGKGRGGAVKSAVRAFFRRTRSGTKKLGG